MGRLENIIARNRGGGRPRERTVVSFVVGGIVLLIIFLMMFTDLGRSPEPTDSSGALPAAKRPAGRHVDGVLLRQHPKAAAPPVAPAQPAAPSPPATPSR